MSDIGHNSKVPIRIRERYLQIILRFAKCKPPCEGRGRWIMGYGIFRLRPTLITFSNLNLIGLFASEREVRSFHLSGGSLIYVYMHTYIYIYIHTHTHTYMHGYIYIYTYAYICTYTYMYIYMHMHTCIYISPQLVHARLCNGAAASLPWKLLRTHLES